MKIHSIPQDAFTALNDPRLTVHTSEDVPRVFAHLVSEICKIMLADVCSLYLYHPESQTLTLKATHGLNTEFINQVIIKNHEGLCGMTFKLMRPISIANVDESKEFLIIPGLGEEGIKSFLAVPLVYNKQPIGVLIVQNKKATHYRKKDIDLLLSLAIPAVNVVERAQFLGALGSATASYQEGPQVTVAYLKDHHIKGIPAAAGIAMGRLKKIDPRQTRRRQTDVKKDIPAEIANLKKAFHSVTEEIQHTKTQAEKKFGPDEVSIFEAYLLLLESPSFQKQIISEIENNHTAVHALQIVVQKYLDRFAEASDEYIKERAYDIQDLAHKISDRLLYGDMRGNDVFNVTENTIFFHHSWSISDFVHFTPHFTKGIISPQGGASSHIAVLAESLGIPAVFGLNSTLSQLCDGDFVIIDGATGDVIINPAQETLHRYREELATLKGLKKNYLKHKNKTVRLQRGTIVERIAIGANIEMSDHVDNAIKSGADEIGLFRTEFPFLMRDSLPTEDEQYQIYRQALRAMKNKPVTFRTLDIGCDKSIPYLDMPEESNPVLGWRSIRFSLERKDLFRIQLRALLKASVFGRMRLLFPMVSTMEQIYEIEEIIASVKKEILDEKCRFATHIPIGYMIEIPAAVGIAERMARRADFLSIGTNDLIQYCLAVDRTNSKVAALYDPYHPAVLDMIQKAVHAARKVGIPISVCGDMAAKPLLTPLLWSFGVSSLSMNPSSIPKIKTLMTHFNDRELKKLSTRVLKMNTGTEIKNALIAYFEKKKLTDFLTK